MKWICCQLGAREHYAVPRALERAGLLDQFITDLWIRPGTFLHSFGKGLSGRFHPGLARAPIRAQNRTALTFELKSLARRGDGWQLITRRNDWFQRRALDHLQDQRERGTQTVFAYSYAAERIFRYARERGWRTVLGQIDPGPAEERLVAELHRQTGQNHWKPAPPEYWEHWREECRLADHIVVNSSWSMKSLVAEGVPAEKIRLVPLAYEAVSESIAFRRRYPAAFSSDRPLRVLFLGQINLRKGAGPLFDAIRLLRKQNVEFRMVGPLQVDVPSDLKSNARVKWFGSVPRLEVDRHYREADVFILPTLSDGFGLTQLEAQSWKLPVVASGHCGEVVSNGANGAILEEVSGDAIAGVLSGFLRSPETLSAMSANSSVSDRFSLQRLARSLATIHR